LFALALVVFTCLEFQARAQTSQNPIAQILIDGPSHFSDSQISLASGLKVGQPADDPVLSAAAGRLAGTGAFSEVSYRYTTSNGKMTVTLHVVDATKTMLCSFDNFVWFGPDEIDRAIRAEAPLYDGAVPLNGDLAQAVATALEHLLAQHHISATVSFLPAAKKLGSVPTEFRYSAKGNLPDVTSVEFMGGQLDPGLFAVAKQRLMGRPFSAAYARSLAENELDVIYQNHAYLRAHFEDPQVAFLPGSNDSDPGSVKLIFTVVPGLLYVWHGADWGGIAAYSAADLDQALGMKEGDPAALDAITGGMEKVRDAYGKKGYIFASLVASRSFDDPAHQVHYSFQIKEGSKFHMGLFAVTVFDDKTAERISKSWQLKEGEAFDTSYYKAFIRKGLPATAPGNPAVAKSVHPLVSMRPIQETLAVDVTVSLVAN
jgi:outer membrane protein assembly factor BamA